MQNIFFFGMSNALINPLIYGAFHLWRPKNPSGGAAGGTCGTIGGTSSRASAWRSKNGKTQNGDFALR